MNTIQKALRMLNDDLISRCEEKWQEWDEAILWLLDLIETVVVEGGYYKDLPNIECMSFCNSMAFSSVIFHFS